MSTNPPAYTADTARASLDAAFSVSSGGAVPARVTEIVDLDRVALNTSFDRIAFTWRVAGGAPDTWVRVVSETDEGAFKRRVAGIWPPLQAWLDRFPGAHAEIEFNDSDELTVFFTRMDAPADLPVPDGAQFVAAMVILHGYQAERGTTYGPVTMYDRPPVERLVPALAARAQALADAGAEGLWFCVGGAPLCDTLAWASEAPSSAGAAPVLASLPAWGPFQATVAAIAGFGLDACPLEARWYASGETLMHVTGARPPVALTWSEPPIFTAGKAPDAAALADTVATVLAANDQAAGRALVTEHLHPALSATVPSGTEISAWFRGAWQHLFDRMAQEPPYARLVTLRVAALSAHLAAMEQEAFELGLARYLQLHPAVEAPAGTLSSEAAGLSADAIQQRAGELLALARAIADRLAADPVDPLRQVPGLHPNVEALIDTLERAVSGAFQAASGRLHDWIFNLGPKAFDNDPTQPSLSALDADTFTEVAIEEVIKAGVDDLDPDDL